MVKRKIFVVGPSKHYANWMEGELVKDLKVANLVVFTGGEDVHPSLYGEKAHPQSYNDLSRDRYEEAWFDEAKELGKHMIGICRGSQFLCVKAGGKLIQYQNNPFMIHPIELYDGGTIDITSTHHQAQYPYFLPKDEWKLLGWTRGISQIHQNGEQEELNLPDRKEAEIVYYPMIKALGIQGHPENMLANYSLVDRNRKTIDYLRDLLDKHMKDVI